MLKFIVSSITGLQPVFEYSVCLFSSSLLPVSYAGLVQIAILMTGVVQFVHTLEEPTV